LIRLMGLDLETPDHTVASELTGSSADDATVGAAMIERSGAAVERFTADGAYDTRAIYEALHEAGTGVPTIVRGPPSEDGIAVEAGGGRLAAARLR
jgi:hypothetical protein